jgi:hypothetical protein
MYLDENKGQAVQFLRNAVAYYAGLGITIKRLLTDNGAARVGVWLERPELSWADGSPSNHGFIALAILGGRPLQPELQTANTSPGRNPSITWSQCASPS